MLKKVILTNVHTKRPHEIVGISIDDDLVRTLGVHIGQDDFL